MILDIFYIFYMVIRMFLVFDIVTVIRVCFLFYKDMLYVVFRYSGVRVFRFIRVVIYVLGCLRIVYTYTRFCV